MVVHLSSLLGDAVGAVRLEIPCASAPTVRALLVGLAELHGDRARRILLDDRGEVQGYVRVLRNGELIGAGDDAPLAAGDEVHLLVPLAGG